MAKSNPRDDGGQDIESPAPSTDFKPYVEWRGSSGHREVTEKQWAEAGIDGQKTVTWTRENPRVELSDLNEEAQRRLSGEPDFHFVTESPKETDQ